MRSRIKRSLFAASSSLLLAASASFASSSGSAQDEGEAKQLYSRANDYVEHIAEGEYSYAYIQFYWKRAQANLDRIARAFPATEVGRQVVDSHAKIGQFELPYFKERVLPRLETKKVAAFDKVNCAIFLYNLDENRWDAPRLTALSGILEVLARQKRWNEALSFPVLNEHRPILISTIFRVAARFQQQKTVDQMLKQATPEEAKALWPILGEAMALNGVSRDEIAKFLDDHPEDDVRLAVLSGMIDREVDIQRASFLREKIKDGIQKVHYSILKIDVRDDIDSVAKTFFPDSNAAASRLVAKYHASLGKVPGPGADLAEHLAYMEYLGVAAKYDELVRYGKGKPSSDDVRVAYDLKKIELLAEGAREAELANFRREYAQKATPIADAAALAEFRGKMDSLEERLTVHEHTFSDLPIKDPCVLSQAISEWCLTPNLSIRGAAPWDFVVQKYLPGFENLPLPTSKDVQEASSASKPF